MVEVADMTRIYLITNLINSKQYVGKTKYTIRHRFAQHCSNDYNTNICQAIKKYGKENFLIEELCRCEDDHWKELEQFYIKKYHTHYTEGGYNTTWGGDDNPMNDGTVRIKHQLAIDAVNTETHRQQSRERITAYNHSEYRKLNDRKTSERQKGHYMKQFQKWNDSKKRPVAMIDENGSELMRFESCTAACKHLNETEGRYFDGSYPARFKQFADKFNKNGKRSRFLGHYWTML